MNFFERTLTKNISSITFGNMKILEQNPDLKNLHVRLREARLYAGLSLGELAHRCGVSLNTIKNAETPSEGLPSTKFSLVIQISEATGVPYIYLFTGSQPLDEAVEMISRTHSLWLKEMERMRIRYIQKWGNPNHLTK